MITFDDLIDLEDVEPMSLVIFDDRQNLAIVLDQDKDYTLVMWSKSSTPSRLSNSHDLKVRVISNNVVLTATVTL